MKAKQRHDGGGLERVVSIAPAASPAESEMKHHRHLVRRRPGDVFLYQIAKKKKKKKDGHDVLQFGMQVEN